MNSASTMRLPMPTLDDDAWEDLLSFIEEHRVIPIVGPELLLVATDRGPRLLLEWVAEKLATTARTTAPATAGGPSAGRSSSHSTPARAASTR